MQITDDSGHQWTISGLLFDMDGTLIDSGHVVDRSWQRWAESVGVADRLEILYGRPSLATVQHCFPDADPQHLQHLHRQFDDIERADLEGIVPRPGAVELLAWITERRIPWSIVTSADAALATARLGASGIAAPHLVTCDDVAFGKPHPEPFLLGAQRIATPPSACLGVEDQPAGISSVRAAGCCSVGVWGVAGDITTPDLAGLLRLLQSAQS